ncbi:hypothetical protein BGZ50_002903 [Haplosporangium sp. Z 11]|nr:hypothetical protein BGZ50_002903 [Haplosporangium sp. Z 11]
MRLYIVLTIATVLTMSSAPRMIQAQDANCTVVYKDFTPSVTGNSGAYQKCYTDQAYNAALVAQGSDPNYKDVINQICNKPFACSHSTLISATSKYMAACSASIDAEAANGNILNIGKNALEIFFAEPIRTIYCGHDPRAIKLPPPAINPPAYCLANPVANSPTSRFTTHLVIFLTSGTIRASQRPFFEGLDPTDVCSPCSQNALTASVRYLADNLMPRISPFYTPEFVQYWTKLVPAYNQLCKTSIVQTWPEGTLNQTVSGIPTGSPSSSTTPPVTSSSDLANSQSSKHSNGATAATMRAAMAVPFAAAAALGVLLDTFV